MNHLIRELKHAANQLGLKWCGGREKYGDTVVVIRNDKIVLRFVYDLRDQTLIPNYMTPEEYVAFEQGHGATWDELGGSLDLLLQKRMKGAAMHSSTFAVGDAEEVRASVSKLVSEIIEFAPDILSGYGLEDGRSGLPSPKPRILRNIDRMD